MRVCVAGAGGFIGTPLVEQLSINNEVVALVRQGKKNSVDYSNNKKVEIIELNFSDYSSLGEVIGQVDCLIVLSWIGTRGKDRVDEELQLNNYNTVYAAIKSAIEHGCKKVITAGSQAEYGLCTGLINEQTPCNPNTAYGKYKLKLFNDVRQLCLNKHVQYVEPRFFSLYGPRDFAGTLIMSTIQKMINNEECDFTESIQMWDYLFVDDAVDAVVKIATTNCPEGAYNFGSGDRRQLKSYIEELKTILGSESKLNFGAIPYGPSGMVTIEPDITKLKSAVNWVPKHSFRDGILKIING